MNLKPIACLYTYRCTDQGGNKMEEIELVKSTQQGDMKAFEQLFKIYKDKAIRTVYLMTGHRQMAEDIVQEAFTTCYLSIRKLKHPEYFKTWFFKLLTRTAWRSIKKEKNLIPTDTIQEMIESVHLSDKMNERDSRYEYETVYEEVLKLEYTLQTTIILYYYNELTVKEIAKVMGCFEGTVKSRLYTARKKLKLHLLEKEGLNSKEVLGI